MLFRSAYSALTLSSCHKSGHGLGRSPEDRDLLHCAIYDNLISLSFIDSDLEHHQAHITTRHFGLKMAEAFRSSKAKLVAVP